MLGRDSNEKFEKLVLAWTMLQETAPVGPIRSEKQHAQMLEVLDWLDPPAIRGIVWDLSEGKEAQARLLQTERLRVLGQMASGVAHDLNQNTAQLATPGVPVVTPTGTPGSTTYAYRIVARNYAGQT